MSHQPAQPQPPTNQTPTPLICQSPVTNTKYVLKPEDSGIELHDWNISRHKGAISSSVDLDEFQDRSKIHCPEMSFLSNHLTLTHKPSGLTISFNTKDALLGCKNDAVKSSVQTPQPAAKDVAAASSTTTLHPSALAPAAAAAASSATSAASPSPSPSPKLQVAAAAKWSSKSYEGLMEGCGPIKPVEFEFDWTYTTEYRGTVTVQGAEAGAAEKLVQVDNTLEIPIAMLQRPDPILWYDSIPLFEDELHDNGVSQCNVRVRVMEGCLLVLAQFWLRVDLMLVRVFDTRFFYEFGKDYAIREQSLRENTFEELQKNKRMPNTPSLYQDPQQFSRKLDLKATIKEKITIPKSSVASSSSTSASN